MLAILTNLQHQLSCGSPFLQPNMLLLQSLLFCTGSWVRKIHAIIPTGMSVFLGWREIGLFVAKVAHKEVMNQEGEHLITHSFVPKLGFYLCISVTSLAMSHTHFFSSYSPLILHRCIPKSALKLYLAGRKGLVLHGDSAVRSQHGDAQLLLSVQGLLVPLLHVHRLKGRDHSHLEVQRKGF